MKKEKTLGELIFSLQNVLFLFILALSDIVRTSLGPKGMDKMIMNGRGEVTITNDGATILKQMQVVHPTAKMLVEISNAQDIEAGDGTTSVVVMAGSLLNAANALLDKGIHPSVISSGFQDAELDVNKSNNNRLLKSLSQLLGLLI